METGVKILLDKAKHMCGGVSDAELARRINVTPQTLNQWRSGSTPLPDTRIAQIAHIAQDPPEFWLVYLQGEKAKSPKIRQHWLNVFNALKAVSTPGKTLPAVALALLLGMGSARDVQASVGHSASDPVYIMRNPRCLH